MGRPRKRLEDQTSHLTKEEIALRQHQEDNSKVTRNLTPPNWLNEGARKVFLEVKALLDSIQVLDDLDAYNLAIFSDAFFRVQELTTLIDNEGYLIPKKDMMIANPNLKTLKDMQKTVLDFSVKLGLNSIDRTKLITTKPKDEEDDPFAKFT